jgi:hypothetical protein
VFGIDRTPNAIDGPGGSDGRSEGVEELRDAAAAVGLAVEIASTDKGVDLVLVNPAGGRILGQVKRVSLASGDRVERQISQWNARSARRSAVESSSPTASRNKPVTIKATDMPDLTVAVAHPGPLMAMKLQSIMNRGAAKEGTDPLDIIRLGLDPAAGPVDLGPQCTAWPPPWPPSAPRRPRGGRPSNIDRPHIVRNASGCGAPGTRTLNLRIKSPQLCH